MKTKAYLVPTSLLIGVFLGYFATTYRPSLKKEMEDKIVISFDMGYKAGYHEAINNFYDIQMPLAND